MALEKLINEPERLGVTQEDAALYKDFRKLLYEIGALKGAEETDKENPVQKKPLHTKIATMYRTRISRKASKSKEIIV